MRANLAGLLVSAVVLGVISGSCGDSGDHAGPGEQCGGFAIQQCAPGLFCDYPDESCATADGSGVCRVAPDVCSRRYDPVCSCEGELFSNECEANAAGSDVGNPESCGLRTAPR